MRGLRKTQPGMFTQDVPSLTDGYRVVRAYRGPASQQCLDDGQAGCLAHVVGVGFECQTPQGEMPAAQVFAEGCNDFADQDFLLCAVHIFNRLQDAECLAAGLRSTLQGLHILGEA